MLRLVFNHDKHFHHFAGHRPADFAGHGAFDDQPTPGIVAHVRRRALSLAAYVARSFATPSGRWLHSPLPTGYRCTTGWGTTALL